MSALRYCYGFPRISIIPRITPIVLNILKHPGSIPDRHGSPRSCYGLPKDRPGFVTVSLRFFTDPSRIDDPASEPGTVGRRLNTSVVFRDYTFLYAPRQSYGVATIVPRSHNGTPPGKVVLRTVNVGHVYLATIILGLSRFITDGHTVSTRL